MTHPSHKSQNHHFIYVPNAVQLEDYEAVLEKLDHLYETQILLHVLEKDALFKLKNSYKDIIELKKIIMNKSSHLVDHLFFYQNDDAQWIHHIQDIHPLMIDDPDILLSWCDKSSTYWEFVWDEPSFRIHLENPHFIKQIIANTMTLQDGWDELVANHPQLWKNTWFIKAALEHYKFDFIEKNLPEVYHDKDFFIHYGIHCNPTKDILRFSTLFDDTQTVFEALKDKPYFANHFPSKLKKNKELINKLLAHNPDWINHGVIETKSLLHDFNLQQLTKVPAYSRTQYFQRVPDSLLKTEKNWIKYIHHIEGFCAVEDIAQRAIKNLPLLTEKPQLLAKTLEVISNKIRDKSGSTYIELMGGAIYDSHAVQEFLVTASSCIELIKIFSTLPLAQPFFVQPLNTREFEIYEESLSELYATFKPVYDSHMLKKILNNTLKE